MEHTARLRLEYETNSTRTAQATRRRLRLFAVQLSGNQAGCFFEPAGEWGSQPNIDKSHHTNTDIQTQRHRDTETHRRTDAQTHRRTDSQRQTHRDRDRHRHTQTHRHTRREADAHTHTDRDAKIHKTDTDTDKEPDTWTQSIQVCRHPSMQVGSLQPGSFGFPV